ATPVSGGRKPPESGSRATETRTSVSGSQKPLTNVRASEAQKKTVEELLWDEPFAFDFFQAVRVLERLSKDKRRVGRTGPARAEVVRFRAHLSLTFPASSIYDLQRPTAALPLPLMTVAFMG